MNEPKHPHFILSDGSYCHVLEDKLYIGKRTLPETMPEQKNSFDGITFFLQFAAFLILVFFITMTIIVHYYMVTFMLGILMLLLGISFIRTIGFTNTPLILKADIIGVQYRHRSMGYDFLIISYSGAKGKLWRRRLTLYDSKQAGDQAVRVLKEAGLLK